MGPIREILDRRDLSIRFLPVIDRERRAAVAWEALIRGPAGSPWFGSLPLLHASIQEGLERELELAAVDCAVGRFRTHNPPNVSLWLNLFREMLDDVGHISKVRALLNDRGIDPRSTRLIVRIDAVEDAGEPDLLRRAAEVLCPYELLLAFDQLPRTGGLISLLKSLPGIHCLKIGRHVVADSFASAVKRVHLLDIAMQAESQEVRLIAEGMETAAELETISSTPVKLLQGYIFGQPGDPPTVDLTPLQRVARGPKRPQRRGDWLQMGDLMTPIPFLTKSTSRESIRKYCENHPSMPVFPVLEAMHPHGLVRRERASAIAQDKARLEDSIDPTIEITHSHDVPANVYTRLLERHGSEERLPLAIFVLWDGLYQGIVLTERLAREVG